MRMYYFWGGASVCLVENGATEREREKKYLPCNYRLLYFFYPIPHFPHIHKISSFSEIINTDSSIPTPSSPYPSFSFLSVASGLNSPLPSTLPPYSDHYEALSSPRLIPLSFLSFSLLHAEPATSRSSRCRGLGPLFCPVIEVANLFRCAR